HHSAFITSYQSHLPTPRLNPLQTPLFPYTTLFRSDQQHAVLSAVREAGRSAMAGAGVLDRFQRRDVSGKRRRQASRRADCDGRRSEEHTSELQSRVDLVCRLVLEKENELMQFSTGF